jgi:hypothetical protein
MMIRLKFMMIRLKFWFFSNYWWLLTLAILGLAVIIVFLLPSIDVKLLVTLLGTFLPLFYFLQKQRLEEIRLFREIFEECNGRYDNMNEKLNTIVDAPNPNNKSLASEELMILNDYFNLCGEEYLYYCQGYIFPSVWKAWYKGMQYYIENPRIADVWAEERKSESYYGLPL